ncbi:oxidoreductase [Catenuloplanes japonicus]|uniref:oxidoreductase n=1 Tax=Catenuloplanes japonicus TaxID=33876 RepID=UPI001E5B129B|nr:oxidoreductase [Catenuloplanes japonicus]
MEWQAATAAVTTGKANPMLTWFITGSSRGFGRQVALRALHNGDRVVATARAVEALKDLQEVGGDNVLTLPLDVTDPEQVVAAATEAEARFGGIDVLFNNAGIGYFAAVEESDEAEIRRMMEINVFGLAAVTNAVLPGMRARRSGRILNVSSVGGVRSFPAVGWYNASKFAVEGLSEALAQEVAPLGIKVVLVEPSGFATDWAGNSAAEVTPEAEIADYAPTAGTQRAGFRAGAGKEDGDPARAAVAIVDVAHDPQPPLRLPLGNYAYDGLLEKLDTVRADIAAREAISRSADRDAA